jgi:hypothetical protein
MNVCAALVADAQSAKAMKPAKHALNDPTPAAKPFARLDAISCDTGGDASPAQPGAMRARRIGAVSV